MLVWDGLGVGREHLWRKTLLPPKVPRETLTYFAGQAHRLFKNVFGDERLLLSDELPKKLLDHILDPKVWSKSLGRPLDVHIRSTFTRIEGRVPSTAQVRDRETGRFITPYTPFVAPLGLAEHHPLTTFVLLLSYRYARRGRRDVAKHLNLLVPYLWYVDSVLGIVYPPKNWEEHREHLQKYGRIKTLLHTAKELSNTNKHPILLALEHLSSHPEDLHRLSEQTSAPYEAFATAIAILQGRKDLQIIARYADPFDHLIYRLSRFSPQELDDLERRVSSLQKKGWVTEITLDIDSDEVQFNRRKKPPLYYLVRELGISVREFPATRAANSMCGDDVHCHRLLFKHVMSVARQISGQGFVRPTGESWGGSKT